MSAHVQLIQFAKWPRAGRVKTRLEPALGVRGALQAHIRLTLAVMEQLHASGYPLQLAWDEPLDPPPPEAGPVLAAMAQYQATSGFQQGADLGERMTYALTHARTTALSTQRTTALSTPRTTPGTTPGNLAQVAMIIGSDCPSVDAAYIEQARRALEQADVVFGPSDDGGYVLIGARRTAPEMLSGVAWGTAQALAQSVAAVERAGLSVAVLEPRWDVDEPADWDRFIRIADQSDTGG